MFFHQNMFAFYIGDKVTLFFSSKKNTFLNSLRKEALKYLQTKNQNLFVYIIV